MDDTTHLSQVTVHDQIVNHTLSEEVVLLANDQCSQQGIDKREEVRSVLSNSLCVPRGRSGLLDSGLDCSMLKNSVTLQPGNEEVMFSRLTPAERGVYLENKRKQAVKEPPVSYAVMTEELVKVQEHCCQLHTHMLDRVKELDKQINTLFFSTTRNKEKIFDLFKMVGDQHEEKQEMVTITRRLHKLEHYHDEIKEKNQEFNHNERIFNLEKGFKSLERHIQEHIAEQNVVLNAMMMNLLKAMFIRDEMSTATPPPEPQK